MQYDALAEALDAVGLHAAARKATVHNIMPRIGSGLAGGDWTKTEQTICRMAVKHMALVLIYTLGAVEDQAAGTAQQGAESMVIDERVVVATLQVQHEQAGQWLDFERCVRHEVPTISVQAVRALGMEQLPIVGIAVLWVRAPDVEGGKKQLASFEVVEEDTPIIRWAGTTIQR